MALFLVVLYTCAYRKDEIALKIVDYEETEEVVGAAISSSSLARHGKLGKAACKFFATLDLGTRKGPLCRCFNFKERKRMLPRGMFFFYR